MVLEWKTIPSIFDHKTNKRFYREFSGQIHSAIHGIIMTTTDPPLLSPPSFEDLHWVDFSSYFNDRSIRRVHRYVGKIQFASLRSSVHVLANTVRNNMQIQITDVELSTFFSAILVDGHKK
jgi:hypothetical protein